MHVAHPGYIRVAMKWVPACCETGAIKVIAIVTSKYDVLARTGGDRAEATVSVCS